MQRGYFSYGRDTVVDVGGMVPPPPTYEKPIKVVKVEGEASRRKRFVSWSISLFDVAFDVVLMKKTVRK